MTSGSMVSTNGICVHIGLHAGSSANVFYIHNYAWDVFPSILYINARSSKTNSGGPSIKTRHVYRQAILNSWIENERCKEALEKEEKEKEDTRNPLQDRTGLANLS